MAKVRTASGLIDCDVMLRTASGLVRVAPQVRGAGGVVDTGASSPMTVSADPQYVYGAQSSDKPTNVSTNATTVTISGGRAPYSYAWGTQTGWTISNPTSATTSFNKVVASGADDEAIFTCTVTDAGNQTSTVSVTAQVSNFGRNDGIVQ